MIDTSIKAILSSRLFPAEVAQFCELMEKGNAILERAFPESGDRRASLALNVRQLGYLEMKALDLNV